MGNWGEKNRSAKCNLLWFRFLLYLITGKTFLDWTFERALGGRKSKSSSDKTDRGKLFGFFHFLPTTGWRSIRQWMCVGGVWNKRRICHSVFGYWKKLENHFREGWKSHSTNLGLEFLNSYNGLKNSFISKLNYLVTFSWFIQIWYLQFDLNLPLPQLIKLIHWNGNNCPLEGFCLHRLRQNICVDFPQLKLCLCVQMPPEGFSWENLICLFNSCSPLRWKIGGRTIFSTHFQLNKQSFPGEKQLLSDFKVSLAESSHRHLEKTELIN